MGKDGSGCLPRIGKRAPAFSASLIEHCHVVEAPSHLGVARTERCFADDQRARVEPLRLPILALVSIHVSEVGESKGHEAMACAEGLLPDDQRAPD
jgi:hypothetical protein